MKNYITAISIFFLGIAIIIHGFLLSTNNHHNEKLVKDNKESEVIQNKQLLTKNELEEYLGISAEEIIKLLPNEYQGVSESTIPFIKIGTEYYFHRKAVDLWLSETIGLSVP